MNWQYQHKPGQTALESVIEIIFDVFCVLDGPKKSNTKVLGNPMARIRNAPEVLQKPYR